MNGPTPEKRVYLGYFMAGALIVFVVVGFFVLLLHESASRADAERERAATEARVMLSFCLELEDLKRQEREDSVEQWSRLDENLALLNIKRTPELVRAARQSLERDLKRNAQRVCPYRPHSLARDAHDRGRS